MDSLQWVDSTYVEKHKGDSNQAALRAMYFPNLKLYSTHSSDSKAHKSPWDGVVAFLFRYGRRTALSLGIYLLTFIPYVGRLVLPAISFYTFNKYVDMPASIGIFAVGIFIPKAYFVFFLQGYFSSRSLMRELLQPYFMRIKFSKEQKKRWFHDREGVLFGFGVGFWLLTRIPLFGVLIYGIAEASTAYLVTKVTDPPPTPAQSEGFAESQVLWTSKKEFLKLPVSRLDAHNIASHAAALQNPFTSAIPAKGEKKAL
jgi:hypothetical protein